MCNKKFKLLVELGLFTLAKKEWRIILSRYVIGAYLEISALEHILH
jgi:hypothetical protein